MPPPTNLEKHRNWLALIEKSGVVVSAVALDEVGRELNTEVRADQVAFKQLQWLDDRGRLRDPWHFLSAQGTDGGLGWPADTFLVKDDGSDWFASLRLDMPDLGITLKPHAALLQVRNDREQPLLLVETFDDDPNLDGAVDRAMDGWTASPSERFERMLRGNAAGVHVGVQLTPTRLRLTYAPPGQMSGHLTWTFADLLETQGRPMLAALRLVLGAGALLNCNDEARLPRLLQRSREAQNSVTTALSLQVLDGLRALLHAFDEADHQSNGALLRGVAADHLYQSLLHVMLRLVFLLFAEERGMLPGDDVYVDGYGLRSLYDRLRDDFAHNRDTMNLRYGAWARLVATFRMIHDGGQWAGQRLPPRLGVLFNPDQWPFLEGRVAARQAGERISPPQVPDSTVLAILEGLLVVQGETLSYRALDVEHIGSVYESMMGFTVEVAEERSVLVGPLGAPVVPASLLPMTAAKRVTAVEEALGRKPGRAATAAIQQARTVSQLEDTLLELARNRAMAIVAEGQRHLQPTDERRRTGSHYTPRSLTGPIVERTLAPLLADMGEHPTPEQILDLKVCDPAMGSGAFLVEVCRQVGEQLVKAWQYHKSMPNLPPDEEAIVHAMRLVASRCIYGVDKNAAAVDLAKLSVWLVTLARDHAFTFLDHALRHGDSLVGLTRDQIRGLRWTHDFGAQGLPLFPQVEQEAKQASELRLELEGLGDDAAVETKRELLRAAEDETLAARVAGDLVIHAFFSAEKDKGRLTELHRVQRLLEDIRAGRARLAASVDLARGLRERDRPISPFHWEIEFPEVFQRQRCGFDAIVGNPPFAGKNTLIAANPEHYLPWLQNLHVGAHGNADLVAHFFRRVFGLLRQGGTMGLIATNTIAQGDTRGTGLRPIRQAGGTIYHATRRLKWPVPGAAVMVSIVHVRKGAYPGTCVLDARDVEKITAFLFGKGGDEDPARLQANMGKSFQGSIVLGMGFTFDDGNPEATPIAEMHRLVTEDPRNQERIFPFFNGEDLNDMAVLGPRRFVINFEDMTETQARRWSALMDIVEAKVKPQRERDKQEGRRKYWWRFGGLTPALTAAIRREQEMLAISQISKHLAYRRVSGEVVFSQNIIAFSDSQATALAVLQSMPHSVWARFLGSTFEDRPIYTPTTCFETFPFPPAWQTSALLESAGRLYHDHRAALMIRNNQGLTATYNRFHDPDEADAALLELRRLHNAMDRVVLDSYGWHDLQPEYGFWHQHLDIPWPERDADDPEHRAKHFRYTWSPEMRDEVLARLLALNAERAAQEARAAGPAGASSGKGKGKKAKAAAAGAGGLL